MGKESDGTQARQVRDAGVLTLAGVPIGRPEDASARLVAALARAE